MASVVSREHRFCASWEDTTFAFWNKYPSKDLSHVKDVLVLERYVDDAGVLHSKRLIHMDQKVPRLLKKFSGGLSDFYAIEHSTVDPKQKRLVLKTTNITFSSIVNVHETCIYTSTKDNQTDYAWEFACTCSIPYVRSSIEKTLTNQAHGNSSTGIRKMQQLTESVQRNEIQTGMDLMGKGEVDSTSKEKAKALLRRRSTLGVHREEGLFHKAFFDFNDWALEVHKERVQETSAAFVNLFANRWSVVAMLTSRIYRE